MCFFVGGIFHPQQTFHEAISEVGSNLMLVAAGKHPFCRIAFALGSLKTDNLPSRPHHPDGILQFIG